jgi:hypothetical protein
MNMRHRWICVLTGILCGLATQVAYAKQKVTCRIGSQTVTVYVEGDIKKGDSCGFGKAKGTITSVVQEKAVVKGGNESSAAETK